MASASLSERGAGPSLEGDDIPIDKTLAEDNPEVAHAGDGEGSNSQQGDDDPIPDPVHLMKVARAADNQALTFAQQNWRGQWTANYKSFRSEYQDNSKYKSADYRHRSQIFRPKVRIAATKDLAGAAQSLFSNVDTVSVSPGDDSDQMQVANAELIQALITYRLDRTSGSNAIPWFLTAMGARQDSQITGVCVSKSYWDYEENAKGKRVKDKPAVDLIPPENVGMDPAASWIDPVQSGCFWYVRFPMHVQDVRQRMRDRRVPWKDVTDDQIWARAKVKEFELAEVRRAREGGRDRLDNQQATAKELDVVWVYEWFIRDEQGDWNFWTLGVEHQLSDPQLTEKAYPWKGGLRPYRVGLGNLESHRIVPQSAIETLRPLQQEINDITNLRLDNLKQVIQPVALVKKGRGIDLDALKRRYPVVYVTEGGPTGDVTWDRPPDSAASSFAETSRLDTDFDDLAGTFNGGSVANNRQVGETVGGMRLMAGAANAVSEFYVRLWVETWVEPVLSDLAKLEAYYEDDTKVLALAKKRAPSMAKFGLSEVTDQLLEQEVLVRVSAGVGSPDPMAKMAKLGQAVELLTKLLAASQKFKSGELQINEEAWINEIMGNAGQRDGFDRFFMPGPPAPPPQPDDKPSESINFKDLPPEGQVQLAAKAGIRLNPGALAGSAGEAAQGEQQAQAADHSNTMAVEKLKARTAIARDLIKLGGGKHDQQRQHKHEGKQAYMDTMLELLGHRQQQKNSDRDFAAQQAAPPPAASQPAPAGM